MNTATSSFAARCSGLTLALLGMIVANPLPCAHSQTAQPPIRVLIQTGQNNHDWAATTDRILSILMRDGRFVVEVTREPERLDPATARRYDVLLSNWNSWGDAGVKEWPAATRAAFLEFVRAGGGLVVVHAGGSSFPDWQEYHELIGGTWGKETGHGSVHRFQVRTTAVDHPITRGVAPFWITDELWHRMALRAPLVLATAFSDAGKGGSGRDEPVAFVTSFGKGRCFNLVLGHDSDAMAAPGFQLLLRRGTEWAARNRVEIPARAGDDPRWFEGALDAAEGYRFGMSRGPLLEVEALVSDATPGSESLLARELARRISRPGGSPDAKRFLCDQLSLLATGDHVPVLAKALAEPELFVSALSALQRIPGPEAREALLSELAEGPVTRQIAILNSLASRGEAEAVAKIAERAAAAEPDAAVAACRALGRIGGEAALTALAQLETKVQGLVWLELRQAQVTAAAELARSTDSALLGPLLEKLLGPAEPTDTRPLALLVAAGRPGAETTQRLVQALRSEESALREAAIAGLRLAGNRPALPRAAAELDRLSPETQVQVLNLIQETQAQEALPQVLTAVPVLAGPARAAALETVSLLGDAETIGPLMSALPVRGEENRRELARALAQLPGPGVDAALRSRYDASDAASQAALVDAIVARNAEGTPAFLERALGAESASVRSAAALGLAQVGDAGAVPRLLQRLATAKEPEAEALETALGGICRRQGNLDRLRETMAEADRVVKQRLLSVAAAVGGPQGLTMVSSQLDASDGEVALTALRLLSEWPDAAAFTALSQTAVQAKDVRARTLALRGIARLAPEVKENGSAAAQTLQSLLASANAAERRTLLTALGDLPRGAGVTALSAYEPDQETAGAAQQAAIKALESSEPTPSAEARKLLERSQGATSDPALAQRLAALSWKFTDLPNLARRARASSPTGLATDGQGGPAAAAVDGNPETYWDEVDQQPLYILRVELERAATVRFLRIQGWKHHEYAPRDFEVWCDGKQVAKVENAAYTQNWLTLGVEKAQARTVELRIHGYYGASPAIRELEIRGTFNPDGATSGNL